MWSLRWGKMEIFALSIPCVIALLFSFFARNELAFWILRVFSIVFLLIFMLTAFVIMDCDYSDFLFRRCSYLNDSMAFLFSYVHAANLVMYAIFGPILLVTSLVLEIRHKQGKS